MTSSPCRPGADTAAPLPTGGPGAGAATAREPRTAPALPVRSVAWARALRPRQWLKNALVLAAPAASGAVLHPGALARALEGVVVFVAASSAIYLLNDVVDREADRVHPRKRSRPVASGIISPPEALAVGAALAAAALAGGFSLGTGTGTVLAAYLVVSAAYSLYLKRAPFVEMACVASGFTLRAVAGGTVVHVALSGWFLVAVSASALLIVAGKRTSEQDSLEERRAAHRAVLGRYPREVLTALRLGAVTVSVATYALWAVYRATGTQGGAPEGRVWFALSIVPFSLAVLLVERAIKSGRGGEPEEIALSDRALQGTSLAWVATLLLAVYL